MKNGFTLVELLAVIVILAVLALIATPVVLSIIDDAKESAMLRSAEMYLSGVENAVMRENMNSGGNFRPTSCTITNGNMKCDATDVEVEVDGEVPSTGSIEFENGKIKEVTLNYTSGTIIKDSSGNLVYDNSEKLEYTAYSVGDEVTIGTEIFYVITDSDATQEKVTLLARDLVVSDKDSEYYLTQKLGIALPAFSTENYWGEVTSPYNIEETIPIPNSHIASKTAYDYGVKVGGTGRLLTYYEATALQTINIDILYGTNGKSSSEYGYLNYWLGSAYDTDNVWCVSGGEGLVNNEYSLMETFGVRPVVEISKTKL